MHLVLFAVEIFLDFSRFRSLLVFAKVDLKTKFT